MCGCESRTALPRRVWVNVGYVSRGYLDVKARYHIKLSGGRQESGMDSLSSYLSVWRTVAVSGHEYIEAVVLPEHREPSHELEQALADWPGAFYWADGADEGRLVLIRHTGSAKRERWLLHGVLFALSFLTVWMSGTLLAGLIAVPHVPLFSDPAVAGRALLDWVRQLGPGVGLAFALTLMGILLAHELGHYITARRYQIDASPPYFLPAPPWYFFIGTFGAFIRLRSPVIDRRQLIDVGAAGPWAGFAVAVIAFALGMSWSEVIADTGATQQVIMFGDYRFFLGDSLMTEWLRQLIVGDVAVRLHPLAQAGWVGILVTALNLMPFGQFDGGHVVYALVRDLQRMVGLFMLLLLVVLGFDFWFWWLWGAFILIVSGGRIGHPSVLEHQRPLPRNRRLLGIATMVLFAVTFMKMPFA